MEVVSSILKGAVVEKMVALQTKSADGDVNAFIGPKKMITAGKDFNKGALKLVACSTAVTMLAPGKTKPLCMCIGKSEKLDMNIWLGTNSFYKSPMFVSKFYIVTTVPDARVANCEYQFNEFSVKVNDETITIKLPMLVSTKKIAKDTEFKALGIEDTQFIKPIEPSKRLKKK